MKDKCINTYTFTVQSPIYLSYDELRSSVASETPKAIETPGKIYFKDHYIFVNEVDKGVHIIDNSNPADPKNISFINIPGNVDIAIKENILYADSYIDLVAIDISNPSAINEINRVRDVFPYRDYNTYGADASKGVVVAWEEKEVTEAMDCNDYYFRNEVTFSSSDAGGVTNFGGAGGSPSVGMGGSMARFTIYMDKLYIVDQTNLQFFDIANAADPNFISSMNIGFGIETIFPYDQKLFIGTTTGMLIYDITNDISPALLSNYSHVTSCDPVVVEGDHAYVTLRSGNSCQGFTNQLEVINIKDARHPVLIKTYPMTNPHGLAIRNSTLFVCDGSAGLKVYDASDVNTISDNMIKTFGNIRTFDVIALNNILLMIGEDGLYQYDYSDLNDIKQISRIPVVK